MNQARRLVFLKGNDAHDYKFSSAVLEDYAHVSPGVAESVSGVELVLSAGGGCEGEWAVGRVRAALG